MLLPFNDYSIGQYNINIPISLLNIIDLVSCRKTLLLSSKFTSKLLTLFFYFPLLGVCVSGVFCSRGSGNDGWEPSGRSVADSAVHYEQVSLCGDIQRTTLSPVHCRDNGYNFDTQWNKWNSVNIYRWFNFINMCVYVCHFFLYRESTFPVFSPCSDRWQRSIFTIYSITSTARRSWRWETLSYKDDQSYSISLQTAYHISTLHTLC